MDTDWDMVKIEKEEIMHNCMCMEMDMAMDPDTEKIILIRSCSNLCCTMQVNRWACLSFAPLIVPFPTIRSCGCKITCDPVMHKVAKSQREKQGNA